ncbi:MAG: hypothetical protein WDZ42_01665, partial [Candidatus Saccharimonadales bacterium]
MKLVFLLVLIFSITPYNHVDTSSLDGAELIATSASDAAYPFGFANNNSGPYIAHNKLWVFYVDNSELVWRTRDVGGGSWSSPQTVFASSNGEYSNLDFDGSHFHFVRTENGDVHGDIKYLRGEASSDGNISFDTEVTAWTESGYEAHREELVIKADSQKQPWIYFKRQNTAKDSFQPTAITSTATDGTWDMRSGFPLALQATNSDSIHGRGSDLIEVEPGKMLFMFIDWVTVATVAREWTAAGGLDDIEIVGGWSAGRMSLVVSDNGTVMANYANNVRRSNGPGEWWSTVNPPDASSNSFNSLSVKGNEVRIWYVDGTETELRYQQTTDGGSNWDSPVTFRTGNNIGRFSASQLKGSDGDYHAIMWKENSSPYDLWMGLEGSSGIALDERSVTLESSVPSEATDYNLEFIASSSTPIRSLVVEVCDEANGTCNVPQGFSAANAALNNQPEGFGASSEWSIDNSDSGKLRINHSSNNTVPGALQSVTFNNVVNPEAPNTTFFLTITTYQNSDYTGEIESSMVSTSTSRAITVRGFVQPVLAFCVGITISGDCSTASGNHINFGEFSPNAASVATSQMRAHTNAVGGYAITVQGATLASGSNIIPALSSFTASQPGTGQFGINLANNTSPNAG